MVAHRSRLVVVGGVNESGFCEDPMIGFQLNNSTDSERHVQE